MLACVAAAGCAAQVAGAPGGGPAAPEGPGGSRDAVVCRNEIPTGSHIPIRTCRSVERPGTDRDRTQLELLRPRASPTLKGE